MLPKWLKLGPEKRKISHRALTDYLCICSKGERSVLARPEAAQEADFLKVSVPAGPLLEAKIDTLGHFLDTVFNLFFRIDFGTQISSIFHQFWLDFRAFPRTYFSDF